MKKTPDLTARIERFREVLRVNIKYADRDYKGAGRDLYLHLHEVKIDTSLCTEQSLLKKTTRDHYYRPEAFWKVFVEMPELVDSPLFEDIYRELCKTVRVSRTENSFLSRRFSNVLTERLYDHAGMKLMKRDGNKHWKSSIPLGHGKLVVPRFMRDLEVEVLGRS